MILRIFRARVKPGMRGAYERLVHEKFVPHVRTAPGLVALHVGKPMATAPDVFVVVSVWKDLGALKQFAGERWDEVILLPGEADISESVTVEHYDDSFQRIGMAWNSSEDALRTLEQTAVREIRMSDTQWEAIRPLLPSAKKEGRPRADDRRTLDGILYVLRTGCRWHDLPSEYGSPVTCWRRLSEWEESGVWERIWRVFASTLDANARLVWANALFAGMVTPTKRGTRRAG